MLDTFYVDGLVDHTCEKPITMIISESRKATLPILCQFVLLSIAAVGQVKDFVNFSFATMAENRFTPHDRIAPSSPNVFFWALLATEQLNAIFSTL